MGDRKSSALAEPALLAKYQHRFVTHKDEALGRTTATKHDFVVVEVVGPLLAQRQKKNAIWVIVVNGQGAIIAGNGIGRSSLNLKCFVSTCA